MQGTHSWGLIIKYDRIRFIGAGCTRSGEDAKRKKCREKQDFNMLGTHKCGNLERRDCRKEGYYGI